MGYCYHELVPPALLLDNPGLTKEEFVEQLDQVHVSQFHEFLIKDPWDSYEEEDKTFHEGLSSLVNVLGLKESERFRLRQMPTIDAYGLEVHAPDFGFRLEHDFQAQRTILIKEVNRHLRNKLGDPVRINISSTKELHKGDLLTVGYDLYLPGDADRAKIISVAEEEWETDVDEEEVDEFGKPEEFSVGHFVLDILPITYEVETKQYDSDEEVYQDYPQFHPAFRFDFDQPKGKFIIALSSGKFLWYQKDGRFYLDPETFDRLSANTTSVLDRFGYADLILTAEAIRYKAWKMLSRRGLKHMSHFLKDFPDANRRYEQCMFDSHLSLAARRKGQSHTELLRMRLQPGIKPLDSSI